jgi:hypothetical protein
MTDVAPIELSSSSFVFLPNAPKRVVFEIDLLLNSRVNPNTAPDSVRY